MTDAGFFAAVRREPFGGRMTQDQVDGCQAILTAMAGCKASWTAYALATAYHETAFKMQPISEMGGDAYFFRRYDIGGPRPDMARRLGNTQPGDGARFHGRGYVQLTGRANYARAKRETGVDLIAFPALANNPANAAKIMRLGMVEGWFTGKKLADYLPADRADMAAFTAARRIINGQDAAAKIAAYAMDFQGALA